MIRAAQNCGVFDKDKALEETSNSLLTESRQLKGRAEDLKRGSFHGFFNDSYPLDLRPCRPRPVPPLGQCQRRSLHLTPQHPLSSGAAFNSVFEVSNDCELTLSGQDYRATARPSFGYSMRSCGLPPFVDREVSRLPYYRGNRGSEKSEGREPGPTPSSVTNTTS